MELRVIDFEVLTRSFQPYIDGYKEMESEKRKMLESINPQKKEMDAIIKRSQDGQIKDAETQEKEMARFRELQEDLMKADSDFKRQLKDMSEDINTSVYDQLSVIISEWSKANSINLVMGKMEVIFNTEDIDATEQILEAIKEKGLYYTESVAGEVVQPTV
jgi:Skp family chaperone for outer membrane proteins